MASPRPLWRRLRSLMRPSVYSQKIVCSEFEHNTRDDVCSDHDNVNVCISYFHHKTLVQNLCVTNRDVSLSAILKCQFTHEGSAADLYDSRMQRFLGSPVVVANSWTNPKLLPLQMRVDPCFIFGSKRVCLNWVILWFVGLYMSLGSDSVGVGWNCTTWWRKSI